jgi:hypothetical protein
MAFLFELVLYIYTIVVYSRDGCRSNLSSILASILFQ